MLSRLDCLTSVWALGFWCGVSGNAVGNGHHHMYQHSSFVEREPHHMAHMYQHSNFVEKEPKSVIVVA